MFRFTNIPMCQDIQNFIVPYSDWSENRRKLAMEYYNSVGVGYHDGWVNDIPPDDLYWLTRFYIRGTETTVDDVKALISETIDEDGWLILMFHYIGEPPEGCGWPDGYWPEEDLIDLADWVSTQDIQVVTQQQGACSGAYSSKFYFFAFRIANNIGRPVFTKENSS